METKQKFFMLYLIGLMLAGIELVAVILRGNQFDIYLVYLAILIVIAGQFQITLQLDRLIELGER